MDKMTKTAACQLYEIVEMLPSEEKNKIPENIISLIDERKERYIKSDKYGVTSICNVYFDTEDSELIRTSIEKPLYKEKLRLRSYSCIK